MLEDDDYLRMVKERASRLDQRAVQIGHLCVAWSALELDVTILLSTLSAFEDAATKNILLGSLDFRAKISATKALGFSRKRSEKWFQELNATLDAIDKVIRGERNRMVHDFWTEFPDGEGNVVIRRTQISPRIVNVQSRTRALKVSTTVHVSPEDISQLCERIYAANARVLSLAAEYERATSP